MNVFGDYSKYYNLLYKDKEYSKEVEYVVNLINKYNPNSKTILDLGCGTGRHDELFAKYGYSVCGIDIRDRK
ncbi:MAG: methyltransferase domain-containing protein, partial [Methanosarcina vacuolata]|nr:methyltransferase domain-containing protein [Methanosarcina vacuolata]